MYLHAGSGKHRQFDNIKLSHMVESLGEDYCVTLLGYCVFSGDDWTSSFKGKGKVRPHKQQLKKNSRFHKAFRQIGDDWNAKPQVMKQLEQFTYPVYGHISKSSVNAVHFKLPRKMVREDNKHIPKSRVYLPHLPRTCILWSHTSSI